MTAGDVYRCDLDWCSNQSFEWWTIPLFVVVAVAAFIVIRRAVREIRRERRDDD